MACLLVPAAEAVVVTVAYLAAKKKEQKLEAPKLADENRFSSDEVKITWSKRLGWLLSLLWGGVLLLAVEHFWHGEIVAYPPFLSAMSSPEDTVQMLHEMSTVGVSMAVCVTAVWGVICAVAQVKVKQIRKAISKESA